jgi:Tfp pilus assembly protein PilV
MIGSVDKKIKRISEKGITLLEGLVSTAIIGIGFVAVFQMVQYSVRSIDVSGEKLHILLEQLQRIFMHLKIRKREQLSLLIY